MKALWVALVWPEPSSSAAGVRTMQLIETLKANGYEIEVCSPCKANLHQEKLESFGIKTASFKPNDSDFDIYLKELNPQLVFFDRFMAEEQFGWRVKEHAPEALRVLDTVDLHSLRRSRQAAIIEGESVNQSSNDAIREISSIYRSDLSLIISDYELELLKNSYRVPEELLELCRFSYSLKSEFKSYEEREHFVAIGNFNHEPNADSFRLLHSLLWPKIKDELSKSGVNAELHIYGAYPTKEFALLDNPKNGFRVKGWTEDSVKTLENYRINLAPLRFGAGIKGKVLDGWAAGTPCIGTDVSQEGMCEKLPFGGAVSDNWDEFVTEAVKLYCNQDQWQKAQQQGFSIISSLYNKGKNSYKVLCAIKKAVEGKNLNREKNFVGNMLWHHQHRSTEYFSRWIEAKNKLNNTAIL